jgi:hypothetical protein
MAAAQLRMFGDPGKMAERVHDLVVHVSDECGPDAANRLRRRMQAQAQAPSASS